MKKMILALMALTFLAVVLPYSVAEPTPEQQQAVMTTVADLQAKGDAARAQKDYEQSIRYYRDALRHDPRNAVIYNKIGLCELQLGRFRAAQSDFERAVRHNRNYPQAINNIGVAAFAQKDFKGAVKNFKKALAMKEDAAVFHANLGEAWFAQDKIDRTMAEFARALELDPEVMLHKGTAGISAQIGSPEERARYSYMLAKLYAKRGDIELALESLKKAKEQGYKSMTDVYIDPEFAAMRQDARVAQLIPPRTK